MDGNNVSDPGQTHGSWHGAAALSLLMLARSVSMEEQDPQTGRSKRLTALRKLTDLIHRTERNTKIDLFESVSQRSLEAGGDQRAVGTSGSWSDSDWNTGQPPGLAATELRMCGVPVFAVGIGSEDRLLDVELINSDAPSFSVAGKTLRIPFRIVSWLPGDRDITVVLAGTRGETIEKTVYVPRMGQIEDTVNWQPVEVGEYDLALQVLVVESYPRWEYRYLRNALERDSGVAVHCLLFHPDTDNVGGGRGYLEQFPDEKQLFGYDVVFLGDVGVESGQLSLENCTHLRQLVRSHAGGLVFLPGFRGRHGSFAATGLEELYLVVPDQSQARGIGSSRPARFALTEAGRRSLLTRLETKDDENKDDENEIIWNTLPGFYWHAATSRAKIGTEVLAVHSFEAKSFGRVPLIATRTSGTGKVLFMCTDGAWRWRKGVEDLYHYRFWGQVVRWTACQRNMSQGESMRMFYSPDRPEANNVLTLNANVMTSTGQPLPDGTVVAQAVAPSGRTSSIRLAPTTDDARGLFTGKFTSPGGGQLSICDDMYRDWCFSGNINCCPGADREQIGQPARFDVLKEIAEVTRGQLADVSRMHELVDHIAALPEPEPVIRRFRLWSHPVWGGTVILLPGLFWTGRYWRYWPEICSVTRMGVQSRARYAARMTVFRCGTESAGLPGDFRDRDEP